MACPVLAFWAAALVWAAQRASKESFLKNKKYVMYADVYHVVRTFFGKFGAIAQKC